MHATIDPRGDTARTDGSLVASFRDGSPQAADALYRRYADRIRALARGNISRGLNRRLDVDDIVQSVFRRFFDAARDGRYQLPSGEELWGLLLVITLNRVRSEEEYQRAGKRDFRVTVSWDTAPADAPGRADDGAGLALALDEAVDRLPAHCREVVRLRLDGYEVAEIAHLTGRSKRTVERCLQDVRSRLRELLNLDE